MSTISAVDNATMDPAASAVRVVSIDIFRGLTLLVMIFVNDLSSVEGLPWWTYHAHASQDAMTYVDMVFPFFLFIVGMSMPLAVAQRLKKNPSIASLWGHVLSRSAGLVVLGLILANAERQLAEERARAGEALQYRDEMLQIALPAFAVAQVPAMQQGRGFCEGVQTALQMLGGHRRRSTYAWGAAFV